MPNWLTWRNFDNALIRVLMVSAVIFIAYLMRRIVTTTVAPASSADAMVQLAQWTIATILTGGAALIGINWYQGERRYRQDRDDLQKEFDRRLANLTDQQASIADAVALANFQATLLPQNYSQSSMEHAKDAFDREPSVEGKRRIVGFVEELGDSLLAPYILEEPDVEIDGIPIQVFAYKNLIAILEHFEAELPGFQSALLQKVKSRLFQYELTSHDL